MTEQPLITDADLREICIELPEDASSDVFITNAHEIMYDIYKGVDLFSERRLRLIEFYLAAHLVAITYPVTALEAISGKVQESYQYKIGLGLNYTKYGQQALALSNGTLASSSISITYLGTYDANNKEV